jgi:hypothetical protein
LSLVDTIQIVETVVHRLSGDHYPNRRDITEDIQITWNENEGQCEMKSAPEDEFIVPHCVGCSEDPVGDLKKWQENADAEIEARNHGDATRGFSTNTSFVSNDSMLIYDEETPAADPLPIAEENQQSQSVPSNTMSIVRSGKIATADGEAQDEVKEAKKEVLFRAPANSRLSPTEEKKKLVRMGLTTAAAIAIHNFPEGLATFVAALHDPAAGGVLAIAIGAHNIPEG